MAGAPGSRRLGSPPRGPTPRPDRAARLAGEIRDTIGVVDATIARVAAVREPRPGKSCARLTPQSELVTELHQRMITLATLLID